jgi:hypothetical protein
MGSRVRARARGATEPVDTKHLNPEPEPKERSPVPNLPARPLTAQSRPHRDGTERRVQVIDIPAGADDELASMASLVVTLEPLEPETRRRVLRWASGRYDSPTLELL